MADELRTCSHCGLDKPMTDFVADRRKAGGRGYRCKECRKAYRNTQAKWPPPMYQDRYASAARKRIAELGLTEVEPWPIPEQLRIGSIATGVAGIELGLAEKLDRLEVAWFCEPEKNCIRLLHGRWPAVPNLGDADLVDWSTVEPVDMLVTGFPCQPFSFAGLRKGEDDIRDLWPTVAVAIRHLQPGYVFIENVPGFLAGPIERTVRFLAEAGYVGRWVSVRDLDLGAPHVRERTFVLAAHPDALGGGRKVGPVLYAPRSDSASERARADRQSGLVRRGGSFDGGEGWEGSWGWFEPAVRRWELMHGPVPPPLDEAGAPNPEVVEWMMGFERGWTRGLARTVRMALLGNSCSPLQAALAFEILRGW